MVRERLGDGKRGIGQQRLVSVLAVAGDELAGPIVHGEVVAVEPGLQELDDELDRLAPRLLQLEGEAGQWFGQLVVTAALVAELGEQPSSLSDPPASAEIGDGLGHAALLDARRRRQLGDGEGSVGGGQGTHRFPLVEREALELVLVVGG